LLRWRDVVPAWLLTLAVVAPTNGELRWHAPAACPDVTEVRARVESHLGRELAGIDVVIDAVVEQPRPDRFQLTLVINHAGIRHERTLLAERCESLAGASALVIALGIDAVAVAEVAQPRIAPAAMIVPEPDQGPLPSRAPELGISRATNVVAPRPHRRPQLVLALAGGLERGAVPGVTGGIDAAIGLRGRGYRFELAGTWLGPRTEATPDASVRVQLGAVAVRGCPELTLGPVVSFPLCIGLELGAMRGAGDDAPGKATRHGLWLAPTISPGLRVGTGVAAFVVRGEVAIAPVRPAFELSDPDAPIRVFTPAPASARLWVGFEIRLGRRDGSTR
jgi:hypothetical protein